MTPHIEETQPSEFDLSVYKELYLKEARACLRALQQNLSRLRDDPADESALYEANRAAHTLKGMSATMRYETLANLAAMLEEPLHQADRTSQQLVPGQVNALLAGCDDFEEGLERLTTADQEHH